MKKIKPWFFGNVKDGKLTIHNEGIFKTHIRSYEGKEVRLLIEQKPLRKPPRTELQNHYYFGCCIPMIAAEWEGAFDDPITEKEIHNWLSLKFLGVTKYYEVNGVRKELRVAPSTASLPTDKFYWYVERVRDWAAKDLNLYIPDPDKAAIR